MSRTTPHDNSGTTLVFKGTGYTVTSITLNFSEPGTLIDVSHLGQTTGSVALTMRPPLIDAQDTGREISFDYIGISQLAGGESGTFAITGPVSIPVATGTISSSSLTLATNDVIRGSATMRYVIPSS